MKKLQAKMLGLVGTLAALFMSGCMAGEKMTKDETESGSAITQQISEFQFLEEQNKTWNDNKVDELHAIINLPINWTMSEGKSKAVSHYVIGEGGGVRLCNYLWEEAQEWRSDIVGITTEGEDFATSFSVGSEHADNFIHNIGPVSGEKAYVACYCKANKEGKVDEYWFYKLDKNFQRVSRVQAKMEMDAPLDFIMGDAKGYYHVIYSLPVGLTVEWYYAVINPDGDKLCDIKLKNMGRLCSYVDGSVIVCDQQIYNNTTKEYRFYYFEADNASLAELSISKDEEVQRILSDFLYDVAPVNENKIAWCNTTGILLYDRESKKTSIVYEWSKHGIVLRDIKNFTVLADGSIGLIYEDAEGSNYLFLKQTGNREALETISFAVSSSNKEYYRKIATLFQKHYPSYIIDIRDDYDQTSLLSRLGAGDGPVLIDTELTGFETLEKLWQPLDGFLKQTGLEEEIYPEVIEMGKIENVTYGIVRNFRIETILVTSHGPTNWDYEGFLNALENCKGAAFAYRYIESPSDWRDKYFDILKSSIDDSYFLNVKDGSTIFGTEKFKRVLKLSDKAANCLPAENGKALNEGDVLCEPYEMIGLWDVLRLHRKMETNGEKAIGYPTGDGARHLLVAQSLITMRSTATEAEKKIAYTFLKYMLSEEAYLAAQGVGFPVFKNGFDNLLDDFEVTVESMKQAGAYDSDRVPELHREKDKEFFEELIKNSKVRKPFPEGLEAVFDEEFGDYLAGTIDGISLDDHLKSRVWLYLEESK